MSVKKKSGDNSHSQSSHDQSMAILSLILNVVILPGLGSLIAGKIHDGVWQIVLYLGGFLIGAGFLISGLWFVGVPIIVLAPLAGWIWGIFTGVSLIRRTH